MTRAALLNREFGAGKPAWLIGTHPLAVALYDGGASAAGYERIGSDAAAARQSGANLRPENSRADRRRPERRVRFASDDQLATERCNVLLLFPAEMQVRRDYGIDPDPERTAIHGRLLLFRRPIPLGDLMDWVNSPRVSADFAHQEVRFRVSQF